MPEDRDQLFEKALAHHLRVSGAAESLCLDAETLAAYQESTLTPEQLAAAKMHLTSCPRCQEVLSRLELAEKIEEAPEPASAGAVSPRIVSLPRRKFSLLRWAAPAGAIAAALLIWIGVRQSDILHKPASEAASQTAEYRSQTAPRYDADNAKAPASPNEPEKQKTESASTDRRADLREKTAEPAVSNLRDEKKDRDKYEEKNSAMENSSVSQEKPARARQHGANAPAPSKVGPSVAAGQAQAADAIQRAQGAVGGRANEQPQIAAAVPGDKAQPKSAPVPAPPALTSAVTGKPDQPAAPPPPRPDIAENNTPLPSAAVLEQKEGIANAEVSKRAAYSRAVSKLGLDIRISAPGGKKIWSVGPNGQILFSNDAGQTWLPQFSGVSANLTGGSAPSGNVCWIAGASGTLLRTTDGGKHWEIHHTPISGDLGGVHASDAEHASIWDVPNRLSFETFDGGKTWKQTANE